MCVGDPLNVSCEKSMENFFLFFFFLRLESSHEERMVSPFSIY